MGSRSPSHACEKHKLAACGMVCESPCSVNRFRLPATARFPGDSSFWRRRCKRKMRVEKENLTVRQRSEAQQRVKIAKHLGGFARKRSANGCRGREFAPSDPSQHLFPILRGGGPTVVLRPFPLHRRVPVAFVAAAETFFLFRDPARERDHARCGTQCECRLLALPARIDAEARGDR